MKRKITFILILLILLTACNKNSLAEYKKAAEKTAGIRRGQTAGEFILTTEINPHGLTAEEIKELNYIKDMEGSFSVVYDDELGKRAIRNYLNFGGLGYDFEVFIEGDQMLIKLPIVGKYLKIEERAREDLQSENPFISQQTIDELTKKWLTLMNEEDVFRGKAIVLTTPDGEVKTREYTIKLNDQQIKTLLEEAAEILVKDKKLKNFYEENIRANTEDLYTTSFEEFLASILKAAEKFKVQDFSFTAYVDIDGYIVNQVLEISLKTIEQKEGIVGFNYYLDIKNWDINKDQNFDFPLLTEENTIQIDDMDVDIPANFIKN
ncbi:MAG: hypothetical protein GX339_00630 [Tissierellia bacterium]|nr:hypothetical protein [Tissierellia bacterium]